MCETINLWGLLSYQPRWGLTPLGWLLLGVICGLIIWLIIQKIHSFLAPRQPVAAEILLIEGWVGDNVILGALEEWQRGNYQLIITTGAPLIKGHFLSQYQNFADLTAATLVALGCEHSQIVSLPTPIVARERTQTAALTVKNWLLNSGLAIQGINIYSWDVHTRRSWLIYRQILSPEFTVGAIAHYSDLYDPQIWWTSSAGVRSIIAEAIAYLYARLTNIAPPPDLNYAKDTK